VADDGVFGKPCLKTIIFALCGDAGGIEITPLSFNAVTHHSFHNDDFHKFVDFSDKEFLVMCDVGDWMCPVNKGDDKKKKDINKEEEEGSEPKGDPEMAPIYLKRLLPVFAQTFQQTMLPSIR